jgi:ribosome-associated translation inhibitor RaiA
MRLHLTASGIELTPDLREHVELRMYFALERLADHIRRVSVRLGDVNGPRGGLDKSCTVRIEGGPRAPIIVRERQSNIHAAVAIAAERAERFLARELRLRRRVGPLAATSESGNTRKGRRPA